MNHTPLSSPPKPDPGCYQLLIDIDNSHTQPTPQDDYRQFFVLSPGAAERSMENPAAIVEEFASSPEPKNPDQ